MINQKFGMLTVIGAGTNKGKTGHKYWTCQCECGRIKDVRGASLRTGHEKSCGCMKTNSLGKKHEDRLGKRFGRLVAVAKAKTERGKAGYLCRCDCGNEIVVRSGLLVSGNTKSCGCGQSVKRK